MTRILHVWPPSKPGESGWEGQHSLIGNLSLEGVHDNHEVERSVRSRIGAAFAAAEWDSEMGQFSAYLRGDVADVLLFAEAIVAVVGGQVEIKLEGGLVDPLAPAPSELVWYYQKDDRWIAVVRDWEPEGDWFEDGEGPWPEPRTYPIDEMPPSGQLLFRRHDGTEASRWLGRLSTVAELQAALAGFGPDDAVRIQDDSDEGGTLPISSVVRSGDGFGPVALVVRGGP